MVAGLELAEARAVAERVDDAARGLEVVASELRGIGGGEREPRAELAQLHGQAIVGEVLARAREHDRAQVDAAAALGAQRDAIGDRVAAARQLERACGALEQRGGAHRRGRGDEPAGVEREHDAERTVDERQLAGLGAASERAEREPPGLLAHRTARAIHTLIERVRDTVFNGVELRTWAHGCVSGDVGGAATWDIERVHAPAK